MRYVSVLGLLAMVVLVAGCDNSNTSDTVPPQISWVYPHDGDTVSPGVYTLTAVATDDQQMDFVVFFAYNEMLGLVRTAQADTYRVAVDCTSDTSHVYLLRAFAYDKADNGTSANVTIYVRR